MAFPHVMGKLIEAGVETYPIDLRRAGAHCDLPGGAAIEPPRQHVAAPGHACRGVCDKAAAAACAGDLMSRAKRRALIFRP